MQYHFFFFGIVQAGEEYCSGITSPGNTYQYCKSNPVGEGNCTWWAAHKRPDLNFFGSDRHAKYWINLANNYHFPIGDVPKIGSIVVFRSGEHGHVAYVNSVQSSTHFTVSEMGYKWFDGVKYSTPYTTSSLGGALGFIYPTKMIHYESDEFSGVLRLDRFDGRKPASCEDAEQFVLYRSDVYNNGSISTSLVVSLLEENTGYLYCLEASNSSYAGDSVNFGSFIQTKTGVSFEDGVGGGSGGGTNNPSHPNLTVDLDLYHGDTRVDDKTHPYGKSLTLKAKIEVSDADASTTAEAGKEKIEVDFQWRIKNSANWNRAGERQHIDIDKLDEGDEKKEHVTITPNYQTGTVIETRVCIDTEKEVRESDEGDNFDEESTTLVTPPTYDVNVHATVTPSSIRVYRGSKYKASFKVSNRGNATIPGTIQISIREDGREREKKALSNLKAGETRTVSIERWAPYIGSHTLQACFAGRSGLTETVTGNNCSRKAPLQSITKPLPEPGEVMKTLRFYNEPVLSF